MTYIREVELDNFKSFAGHTKFTFVKGFNVIAGANGSGKSNIIDALMFVLGASSKREMRSEVLTDLVFNGGKNQKAAEFAKVNIILDNSDKTFSSYEEKEISISRKVDKSGKSIFRINGKASTREEILNILSIIKVKQDSFNIIPQGKISEIAGSSPEERLGIINDLSGISVFEEKKSKAMNEMGKVEGNISKIETVQKEKKRLMEELENDKKRAEEFKELKKTQTLLQAKQALIKKNFAYTELEGAVKELSKVNTENAEVVSSKDNLSGHLLEIRNEINRINTEAEKEGEKEISEAESKAKALDVDLTKLRAVSANDKEQISNLADAIDRIKKEISDISESSEKENSEINGLRSRLNQLNSRRHELTEMMSKAENYFKEKESGEKQLNEVTKKIYEYRLALSNYPRIAELQSKLSELNATKAKLDTENRDMTVRFSELRPAVDKLKLNVKKEEDTLYWLRENLLTQKTTLNSKSRAIDTAEKLKKEVSGVYGTVNELFTVVNETYTQAIFRSIGRRGDFIIVENEAAVSKCIEKLKRDKLGNFNFIPLNKIVYSDTGKLPSDSFVIDFTINLVKFDEKVRNAMKFVFGDTVLVESFEDAKSLINRYRMVTLDGTVFEKTGVISGGYQEEINFANINKKYQELNSGIDEHTKLKEKYQVELDEKNATLNFLMSKIKGYEKDLYEIKNSISAVSKEISNFKGSESEISETINKLDAQKLEIEEKLNKIGADKYERVDYRKDIEQLDREINQIQIKLGTSTTKIENIFKSELADLLKRNSDLEKQRAKFETEIETISKKITDGDKNLQLLMQDLSKKSDALLKLREKRVHLNEEAVGIEDKLGQINKASLELQNKINDLRVREAELKVKFETANEEFSKFASENPLLESSDTVENISKKLLSISSKIDRFGLINETALDKFNKVLEEYNEFNTKLVKLNEEKEKILAVIKDIEAKKLETFMKTLSEINGIFSQVFNSITSGKAELIPDNPQDVFGGGLDISVELPNKKVHNIRGLSGGEMSILSISLLMSISKYIDVPFYVLDEVDAALDSVNSSKFSSLVKAYSENTEFVVISHNETTMINADVIYGVTMTGEGVSKVVSVKMPNDSTKTSSA